MDTSADDLPEIRWGSAAEAFQWAEELVSRPDVQSSTQQAIQSLRGNMMRGSSKFDSSDYRDLAETILVEASMLSDQRAYMAMRVIQGTAGGSSRDWLGVELAKAMMDSGAAEGKAYGKVSRIAKAAVVVVESRVKWNKPVGLNYYAWAVGLDRSSMYSGGWKALIAACEGGLYDWLHRAERGLNTRLQIKGIM